MGTVLQEGDLINTGKGGVVELLYKDGSKVTIKQKSSAKVGSATVKGSSNVSLISGKLTGKFSKLKKGKRKVYTPTTICAIRGTEFDIAVSKDGTSRVDLSEGKLDVSNPYGTKKIKEGTTLETEAGKEPQKGDKSSDLDSWQEDKNAAMEKDPNKTARQYKDYVSTFKRRSLKSKNETKKIGAAVKGAKSKSSVEKTGESLASTEETIEDDLILNETSVASIEGIMKDFEGRNNAIFRRFKRLKEESNRVLEQQQKNYQAIQAVKDEHRKAKEKIMGKFQKDKDSILKGVDMKSVKPSIKK